MATLTIANLPETVLKKIEAVATRKGYSVEQEVRELLESRYASRTELLARAQRRWSQLPETLAEEVESWRKVGRP